MDAAIHVEFVTYVLVPSLLLVEGGEKISESLTNTYFRCFYVSRVLHVFQLFSTHQTFNVARRSHFTSR